MQKQFRNKKKLRYQKQETKSKRQKSSYASDTCNDFKFSILDKCE